MEEWREVTDRMRSTLQPIADGRRTTDFLRLLNTAYTKLVTYVDISRRILMAATDLELEAIPTPPPDGYSPMGLIELARLAFQVLRQDHAVAGHIFVLYGTRRGFLQGDPLWQTWEIHHAAAIQKADGALQGLHDAAASWQAAADAYRMAMSFPRRSPAWVAWISAGHSLTRSAVSGVIAAALRVRQMRQAVHLEYVVSCAVLSR